VHIEDAREKVLPNLGVLALQDAETGAVIELDTADSGVRRRFNREAIERARHLVSDFRAEGVDTLELDTNAPYLPALQRFFKSRERRHA
jgi:hypothetical protein